MRYSYEYKRKCVDMYREGKWPKNEVFYGCEKDYRSFEEFSTAMSEYINYYNNERIQTKTKWMPPVKYRMASNIDT